MKWVFVWVCLVVSMVASGALASSPSKLSEEISELFNRRAVHDSQQFLRKKLEAYNTTPTPNFFKAATRLVFGSGITFVQSEHSDLFFDLFSPQASVAFLVFYDQIVVAYKSGVFSVKRHVDLRRFVASVDRNKNVSSVRVAIYNPPGTVLLPDLTIAIRKSLTEGMDILNNAPNQNIEDPATIQYLRGRDAITEQDVQNSIAFDKAALKMRKILGTVAGN